MKVMSFYRKPARLGSCVTLAALAMAATSQASAESILLAQTSLVTGTDTSVASITVPSAGTLTVDVNDLPWPQSLTSLNFMLSSAGSVIDSWSTESSNVQSYTVTPGTYYTHLTGTAGGSLDLGLYSITVGFQPQGVVPLPASGILLLFGLIALTMQLWPRQKPRSDWQTGDHDLVHAALPAACG